jgi:hypothetical protein
MDVVTFVVDMLVKDLVADVLWMALEHLGHLLWLWIF